MEKLEKKSIDIPYDFSKSAAPMMVLQAVRMGFLWSVLLITLLFQGFQAEFVNSSVLTPVYILLATSFVINFIYLAFFMSALRFWAVTAFLFFWESVFITGLIYYSGVNQSIFLLLYLVNIILCGFVFQKRGAWMLSIWTSILFSMLLIVGPDLKGQTLFFTTGINNLAFFAVAWLSSILGQQMNFMGTQLRAQVRQKRALQNINQIIIENIATGLITIDKAGHILLCNPAAQEILAIRGQVEGSDIEILFPGILKKLESGLNERSFRFDWPYWLDAQEKLVLGMLVTSLHELDDQAGFIFTFQDLTKIRKLEFAMRQSEKLAAVGQLAAGIAHEIRNPLASISGSVQLLTSSFTARQEEERRLMTIVLKEIDRLNNLITEFLDFVRPEALREDPIDLNSLLNEILDMAKLNKNLRKDIDHVISLNAKSLMAGHKDKLKQALLNIIINAYQAMQDSPRPILEVRTEDRDGSVLVRIRDHGVGIEESRVRKIFEPFHTTKPKGTGLGLAVTHKIIEAHQGKIFVESVIGKGTEFILEFPAQAQKLPLAQLNGPSDDLLKKRGNG